MADVRCPKCGKSNPAEAAVCRYCQQPLAPTQRSGGTPAQPSSADEPDWLRELRSDSSQTTPAVPEEAGESEVPDWLARIRQREDQSSQPEEGSDWLNDLRSEPASQENQDGWLNGLQGWQAPTEEPKETPAVPSEETTQPTGESLPELSNWLEGLQRGEEPAPQPQAEAAWEPQEPQAAPASEPDLQTWLQSLDQPGSAQPAAPQDESPKESVSFTGWLRNIEPSDQPTASTPSEMPTWLEGAEDTTPVEEQPTPAPGPVEGIPSWLAGLEEPAPTSQEPELPSETENTIPAWLDEAKESAAADQIPAWLSGAEETPVEIPQPTRAPTEELPAWMAGFAAEEPPVAPPQPTRAPTEELPAWMAGFATEPESSMPPPAPVESIPAWMAQQPEDEVPAVELPPVQAVEIPSWLDEPVEEEVTAVAPAQAAPQAAEAPADDWLAAFGKISEQPAAQEEPEAEFGIPGWQTTGDKTHKTPSTPLPFIEENIPAWLNSVDQGVPPEAPTEEPALIEEAEGPTSLDEGAPFKVELPDWIGQEPTRQPMEAGFEGEEEPQLELAHAELPSWVEEMRPVESAIGGEITPETDQRVEKAGPLAGLRGILPGEEIAVRYRKLPVYSVKLRVSERQRQYINLLENVIAVENQPQPVPSAPSQAPQYILRLAIGLLLIVALLLPPLFNILVTPLPAVAPAGLLELYDLVETLPDNAPVLLAVDYEPALAGELQLASSAVIEHLMVKNARLAVISTVPSGPIMAQQLVQSVQLRQPGYNLANQVVNLSYLAGGTSSLLEFANRPHQAAPVALDSNVTGDLPWSRPALQGIHNLQDFALVIVLTDSAENGRAWVEQVQPMLGETPLTMVTSAQAAPLLLPYLDSQQVRGLVSGLYGGAMYEKRSGRISLTPGYYMGYQGAFLVGILILFLGGTVSLALSMTRRAKKGKA
jgi:hypothetical protein